MPTMKLTVSGADFSGTGLGKFFGIPDVRGSLYAAYLIGSDFVGAGAKDLSGKQRSLSFIGGAPTAKGLQCAAATDAHAPFTPNDVIDEYGESNMIAIARAPANANNLLVGSFATVPSTGDPYLELSAPGAAPAPSAQWNRVQAINRGSATAQPMTPADANRGVATELYAGVFTATSALAYRGRTGLSENASAARAAGTFGGSSPVRFGGSRSGDASYGASSAFITAGLVYSKALTIAELDYVRQSMTIELAKYGLSL